MNNFKINITNRGLLNPKEVSDVAFKMAVEKNKENYKKVSELLEMSIKTKTLITLVSNNYRGLGKSQALIEKALELDSYLVVPWGSPILLDYHYALGEKRVVTFSCANGAKGVSLEKGFLVDEGVGNDIVAVLSERSEFLGGFSRVCQ